MESRTAFSLLELLITVAIIAILAGVAVPAYQSHADRAQDMDAQMVLRSIGSAQERYRMLNGVYFNQNTLPSQASTAGVVSSLLGGVQVNSKYYYFSVVSATTSPLGFIARASSRRNPAKWFTINQVDCLQLNGTGACL